MEAFNIVWVKLPILTAIFIASPWILYQVWGFIAPGLYKKERRWAAPFVICSAGLFIAGGAFGYFVAFRYGLTFLLSLAVMNNVTPMVSMTEYFDLFVNVMLGIGLIFEMPVLIFFLTLLHLASPRFLINHSRYAGCLQSDAVRGADVCVVLHRDIRRLSTRAASGEQEVPMASCSQVDRSGFIGAGCVGVFACSAIPLPSCAPLAVLDTRNVNSGELETGVRAVVTSGNAFCVSPGGERHEHQQGHSRAP